MTSEDRANRDALVITLKKRKTMDIVSRGLEFEQRKTTFKTTSERIEASREVKSIILGINEIYKKYKDANLMDLMKRLTVIKQKIEKRLKGRLAA